MKHNLGRDLRHGLFLGFGLLSMPCFLYFTKFDGPLSNSPSDWGTFGDFLNPFVALLNVLAFVYLTYVIHSYEARQEKRRTVLPVLFNAMNDLVKIELAASTIDRWLHVDSGTIDKLKADIDEFAAKYFAFLEHSGISADPLRTAFHGIKNVFVYQVPWNPDLPVGGIEKILKEDDRALFKDSMKHIRSMMTTLQSHLMS